MPARVPPRLTSPMPAPGARPPVRSVETERAARAVRAFVGGDPSTVRAAYIDLKGNSNGNIFHSNSVCAGAGMSNGSLVAIEFIQAQGFTACPYCW